MRNIFFKISKLFIVFALCLTFSGCALFQQSEFVPKLPDSTNAGQSVKLSTADPSSRILLSRVQAVKKIERSVVAIKMTYNSGSVTGSSSGSGVIIDNGDKNDNIFYVLTCFHVISSGGEITVYAPDANARNFTDADYNDKFAFEGVIDATAREGELTLIGGDQKSDIAVLKLDVSDTGVSKDQICCSILPPNNTQTEIVYEMMRGEEVFAIGNPSGKLPMTVSSGSISYIDREAGINDVGFMNLLQIDVQTNHGSSGGGLFNLYGELIGITNAGSDTYDGVNYAIPYYSTLGGGFVEIAEALVGTYYNVWDQKNHGYVSGNWAFGITVSGNSTTATVLSVVAGSNADRAKIESGDLICGFSFKKNEFSFEKDIESKSDLEDAMYVIKKYLVLGDKFNVIISRGGERLYFTVLLTEQLIFMDTGVRLPENDETV